MGIRVTNLSTLPVRSESARRARDRSRDMPERAGETPARLYSLDDAMADHIRKALAVTRGKIEGGNGAAHILGINPHTLRARMRQLGIAWNEFRAT